MGSVSCHHLTESQLALEELGVPLSNRVVHKAAGGSTGNGDGSKITWYVLESVKTGQRFIALALTSRSQRYGSWCKVMDESVGPCYYDVPDVIWNNRPPVGPDASGWTIQWRLNVAERRASTVLLRDVKPGQQVQYSFVRGTLEPTGDPAIWLQRDDPEAYGTRVRMPKSWLNRRCTVVTEKVWAAA